MTQIEDVIVSSITELIRVFVILEYLKTFLEIRSVKCNVFNSIITYSVTLFSYLVFHNVLINLFVTIVGIVFLSTGFVGQLKKKLLLSIMVYGIMFVIDLLASFLLYEAPDSNNYEIISSFISVIFFYIVVICIKKIFKENGKIDLSGQWYLLLFSALLSIAALYIVYKDMTVSREAVITISVIVLLFNIMLYIFYMSMLVRFIYESENLELKQQMNIYEQQIRNDIDNSRKLRGVRHDMKHHIREINDLLTKNKVEQAKDYLYQMNNEILNAQNMYNTGHEAFDGILNYYAEKYANKSLKLEVSVAIPENLEINIFDVNIVLGNLLDNALENAISKTQVDFSLKYNAGMLHISISNLFEGNVKRVDGNIVSRKGENHGLGLDNIKRIVEKYDGTMVMECDGGRFDVDVIMFVG